MQLQLPLSEGNKEVQERGKTGIAETNGTSNTHGVNGVLMGLIVITPLAGYVSPGSAVIIGNCSEPGGSMNY